MIVNKDNRFIYVVKAIGTVLRTVLILLCCVLVSVAVVHSIVVHYKTIEQLSETTNVLQMLTFSHLQEAELRRSDDQLYSELLEILMRKSP